MNIAVIGGAGGVGRRVVAQAVQAGHTVRALVRREEQAEMLRLHGGEPVLGDLTGEWEEVLDGADAVVWAARGGASIDRDALIRVANTLTARGPGRLIVVSSMAVDRPEQAPPFLEGILKLKAVSDAHVQGSDLDWTIVRPGGLSDTPGTGRVQVGEQIAGGMIPRDDVATVVLACLNEPSTTRQTFEVVAGRDSVGDALAGLGG